MLFSFKVHPGRPVRGRVVEANVNRPPDVGHHCGKRQSVYTFLR